MIKLINDEKLEILAEKYLKYKKYFWANDADTTYYKISKTKPKGKWHTLPFNMFIYCSGYETEWNINNVNI